MGKPQTVGDVIEIVTSMLEEVQLQANLPGTSEIDSKIWTAQRNALSELRLRLLHGTVNPMWWQLRRSTSSR